MEIRGSVWTVAIVALAAAFLVQFAKRNIPEEYHKLIPGPLAIVMIGIGVLAAYIDVPSMEELTLVQGGTAGFVAAALAAYGYDFVNGAIKYVQSRRENSE